MTAIIFLIATQAPPQKLPMEFSNALRRPERVLLLSVNPMGYKAKGEKLGDNTIARKIEIKSSPTRLILAKLLATHIVPFDGVGCFEPHDAMRVVSGKHRYDFLICFECRGIELYKDGKEAGMMFSYDHTGDEVIEKAFTKAIREQKASRRRG